MLAVKIYSGDKPELNWKLIMLAKGNTESCGIEIALYQQPKLDDHSIQQLKKLKQSQKSLHSNHAKFALKEISEGNLVAISTLQQESTQAEIMDVKKYIVHASTKGEMHNISAEVAAHTWVDSIQKITDAGLVPYIEKTYESLQWFKDFYTHYKGPTLGFCLDIGHTQVGERTLLDDWSDFTLLLQQQQIPIYFHIHGNDGITNQHIDIKSAFIQGLFEPTKDWAPQGVLHWLRKTYKSHPESTFCLESPSSEALNAYFFARLVLL